ncbi:hypothetical protein [Haloprofundus salinisoli]|uniref:hypothetical protein n=1 Tax=Haloprofundus salinisoli TaxID=2876193 RepID=UPI001CCBBBC8|nr:hypothetical protein [Haloprofundus salinisoli]
MVPPTRRTFLRSLAGGSAAFGLSASTGATSATTGDSDPVDESTTDEPPDPNTGRLYDVLPFGEGYLAVGTSSESYRAPTLSTFVTLDASGEYRAWATNADLRSAMGAVVLSDGDLAVVGGRNTDSRHGSPTAVARLSPSFETRWVTTFDREAHGQPAKILTLDDGTLAVAWQFVSAEFSYTYAAGIDPETGYRRWKHDFEDGHYQFRGFTSDGNRCQVFGNGWRAHINPSGETAGPQEVDHPVGVGGIVRDNDKFIIPSAEEGSIHLTRYDDEWVSQDRHRFEFDTDSFLSPTALKPRQTGGFALGVEGRTHSWLVLTDSLSEESHREVYENSSILGVAPTENGAVVVGQRHRAPWFGQYDETESTSTPAATATSTATSSEPLQTPTESPNLDTTQATFTTSSTADGTSSAFAPGFGFEDVTALTLTGLGALWYRNRDAD